MAINDSDWISKLFQLKKKQLDDESEARDSAKREREVFDSLIQEFWEGFKDQVRNAVASYNEHVDEPHTLRITNPSTDALQIEKVTQPFLRLTFALNRSAQLIKRTDEFSSIPVKTMLIGVAKHSLYLNRPKEDSGAGQIIEQEIPQWVLGDVFAKLIGLKAQ